MNSKKITLFILIIFLIIPPFFSGGTDIFIKGMVFVLAGLAGLLFIFGVKSVGHLMGRPTLAARTIAPQSAVRLHTEYGASEVAEDLNPLNPSLEGENNALLIKKARFDGANARRGGKGGLWRVIHSQGMLIFLFLYLLFSFISVFFSASPYESAVLWLESLNYAILFLVVAFFHWEKKEIDFLIKFFLAVSGLLCLVGIYFYLVGSYSRLTSLFWWPNPFAGYLLFSLFLGIDWVLNCHFDPAFAGEKSLKGDISTFKGFLTALGMTIQLLFLSIILSSFILTGSRGAFLSFLIVLLVYFYFKYLQLAGARNYKSPQPPLLKGEKLGNAPLIKARFAIALARRGVRGIINILAVILLSIVFVFIINSFKNDNFSFVNHFEKSGTQSDFSSSIRLNYWRGAWEMFKDRPLTGWGAGTFGTVYYLYQKDPISSGKYAHNWYLEMLAEGGIFVFLFFFLFLFFIFFNVKFGRLIPLLAKEGLGEVAWRHPTSPPPLLSKERSFGGDYSLSLFCALLASILHNGVDIDWHFPANAVVFWIFLGLLYNIRGNNYSRHCEESAADDETISAARIFPRLLRYARNDKIVFFLFNRASIILVSFLIIFFGIILLHVNYFYEQGLKSKEENNLAEAEIAFKKSVFLNSDPDYLRELGIIKYSRALNTGGAAGVELLNQALEISKKIIKYDSYNSLNYELAGKIYLAQGDLGESEKNFQDTIRLNKFNPKHYINFAILLINEGKKEEARYLINKILFYYPEEVVSNKKMYIMPNQEITSGIEKDIEYLRYLLGALR